LADEPPLGAAASALVCAISEKKVLDVQIDLN
jgi:hypothetical protein